MGKQLREVGRVVCGGQNAAQKQSRDLKVLRSRDGEAGHKPRNAALGV